MAVVRPDWKSDGDFAVGKGATVQQFVATVDGEMLEIQVAPWGEGLLRANGREVGRIDDSKDRRQAFTRLCRMADSYLEEQARIPKAKKKPSMIPTAKAKLLDGKKGLIVGIANDQSIAWGCAKAFRALGADLAVTYLKTRPGNSSSRWRRSSNPTSSCRSTS
jgi:enoyl-[acyl-carrier protein] reductase I